MADTVKHTPGPWQIEGRYEGDLGSLYLSTMHPMPIFELQPLVGSRDEHLANACLIAAAPDLLDALGDFASMKCETAGVEDLEGGCCRTCRARAAIAKAEGRS